MKRTDLLEKLGKIEGKRRRGQQRMRWLNIITNAMEMNSYRLTEEQFMEKWTKDIQRQFRKE